MIGVKPEGADGAAVHVIGGEIDLAWVRDFSIAHERADFDKVLVGYTSTSAEGFVVAGYAASRTERLGYLIAHRPGFVAPTLAARSAASLDHVTGGRVALHIITGGSDAEQARDGDWLDHDTRYRRTDEYLDGAAPHLDGGPSVRPRGRVLSRRRRVLRGEADAAAAHPALLRRRVGGGPRDRRAARRRVHALGRAARRHPPSASPRCAPSRGRRAASRGSACRSGRSSRDTEGAAWDRARAILAGSCEPARASARRRAARGGRLAASRRVRARRPRCTTSGSGPPIAGATGASGQHHRARRHARAGRGVAARLLRRRRHHAPDPRVRPAADAVDYGRELIPLVRAEVARRDRNRPAA